MTLLRHASIAAGVFVGIALLLRVVAVIADAEARGGAINRIYQPTTTFVADQPINNTR